MKLKSKVLSVIVLSVLSQSVNAIPFTFDGRSLGMGGVSVATADLATAAWANPAMLTNQRPNDDFSLLIGVGALLRDDDDLVSDIDDFQDADARFQAAASPDDPEAIEALQDMTDIISGIDGKDMAVDVSGVAAMGIAFDTFAMALSFRSDTIGAGAVDNISTDPADLISTDPNNTTNVLNLEGVTATEFGLSIARDFQFFERKVSIGIKPKIVDLQAFTYKERINTIDGLGDVFDKGEESDLGTFTSFDLGVAIDLSDSFRLGLNIRNLITDKFNVAGQTLNFDTEARIGVAYRNRFLTVAADYDLVENEPLLANPSFDGLKTQYIALGAEFNAFDFAQLRVGASKNLASGVSSGAKDTAFTAGIGFWLGFNLDIAATLTNNSVGAFVQTGFRF